jgi:hypothetical protein
VTDCNEWKREKRHECTNMGKGKRLELWWQLYVTWLPVRDLENFGPLNFCWTECTSGLLFRGRWWTFWFRKLRRISWLLEKLFRFTKEVICYTLLAPFVIVRLCRGDAVTFTLAFLLFYYMWCLLCTRTASEWFVSWEILHILWNPEVHGQVAVVLAEILCTKTNA